MGLFDFFKAKGEAVAPAPPASIDAAPAPDVLCAPIAGRVIGMRDVPDPVFAAEALGKGCAIWPEGDVAYAPIAGTVTMTMGHAVGVRSAEGLEALVHAGVDTVNLQGKGFTVYVERGDEVVAGQPLIKMDRTVIAEAGYRDCVILSVTNSGEFDAVSLLADKGGNVAEGMALLQVKRPGDGSARV